MGWPQVATLVVSLAGTVVGTGAVIATLILRTTARLDRRIDSVHQESSADRRAFQAGMDDFRREMLRLAERTAHVEGKAAAE